MSHEPEPPAFRLVDTAEGLEALLPGLAEATEIALDTEADSLHHYFEKVCLIQMSTSAENVIVDPLRGLDLADLLDLLARKPLVLHGADYDLRLLHGAFGFRPHGGVFDTMLAARLLGHAELGLASLVDRFFGVHLDKGGQKSDWSRRPLSRTMLDYASSDTRYLLPLAARLGGELERMGRTPWHRETCEVMVRHASRKGGRDPDEAWRIKGSGGLNRRELHLLRALVHWRDREARQADLPAFRILGNEPMLALAVRIAAHPEGGLPSDAKLPGSCKGNRRRSLEETLRQAARDPTTCWPSPRREEPRPARVPRALNDAIRRRCGSVASAMGIAASTLAPRSALENLARCRPATVEEMMACGPLMRWQARILHPELRAILEPGAGRARTAISREA